MPLFLDKEGRWFHEGVEITHERTRLLFSKSIRREASGKYILRIGTESAEVVVEDAPYTIRTVRIEEGADGRPQDYIVCLNDETQERLGPESLSVGRQNVMYCKVKEGSERARVLRAPYYRICTRLEYDATTGQYWLPRGQGRILIQADG